MAKEIYQWRKNYSSDGLIVPPKNIKMIINQATKSVVNNLIGKVNNK